ncbi:MAG: cation transporter [Oscillochloris sp.]|nr:cation transporter [Oscillochloris sp.]
MTMFQTGMAGLMLLLSLSLGIVVWRLLRGPTIPDQTVAFDMIIIHLVALIVMYAITTGVFILIDVVIVIAVLGFLGTVAIARFIEEGRN